MKNYFSFDTESAGLFGPPFAVGWVVVDKHGAELEEGYLACPLTTTAPANDLRWVQEHVLPTLPIFQNEGLPSYANCENLLTLMDRFWGAWLEAKQKYENLTMVTDCPFPVEAAFLLGVAVRQKLTVNTSPYPILDVASVLFTADRDPLGAGERKESEHPPHNPVNDARQSVRLLVETLNALRYRDAAHLPGVYLPGPIGGPINAAGTITSYDSGWCSSTDTLSAETYTEAPADLIAAFKKDGEDD